MLMRESNWRLGQVPNCGGGDSKQDVEEYLDLVVIVSLCAFSPPTAAHMQKQLSSAYSTLRKLRHIAAMPAFLTNVLMGEICQSFPQQGCFPFPVFFNFEFFDSGIFPTVSFFLWADVQP